MADEADQSGERETARIEAFSDGVYAIAITLLVLDLKVPDPDSLVHHNLGSALLSEWPSYLAYVISFLTILIMWINHHRLFTLIHKRDHLLMVYNGLLLMAITLVPFPTALLARYLETPNSHLAASVFSGFFLMVAIFYNILWRHIARDNRLFRPGHDTGRVQGIHRQYNIGLAAYAVAFLISFISPTVSVALGLLLAVYFALPEKLIDVKSQT